MRTSAHQADHRDPLHSTYPYCAGLYSAGPTHQQARLVAVAVVVLLVAVGIIATL